MYSQSLSHFVSWFDAGHRPSLVRTLRLALAAHRQRQALAALEAHRLCDLGISADDARTEAAKPIWNVPANWLR